MNARTTDTNPAERPWSVTVAVAEVAETGRHVELAADAATREAVAKLAGVVALPRLEAVFDLTRIGRDGLRVVGRVSATVDQSCVVTLDPVRSEIDEAVDLAPVPPAAETATGPGARPLDAEEPPELLQDGTVDLGAVATEYLMLGIDPYPRKAGATLPVQAAASDPSGHPFAALAALKPKAGGKPQ